MPTENRSNDADGWIACDDGLHLIQMDKNLSHYGWVFKKVDGSLPYSVREATPHEMAHAQARQHLRIGVAQIAGQAPAPQPHPEPIAWMVGTAFWWTKEEAERDAAATGLPIVGLGPMAGVAPAQQHQGEPIMLTAVATLVDDGDGGLEPDWLLEGGTAELFAGMTLLVAENAPDLCSEDGSAQVYTHPAPADPAEVERLRDELEIVKNNDLKWRGLREQEAEIENLRAQLAEQESLLHDSRGCVQDSANNADCAANQLLYTSLLSEIDVALSASAEPRPFRMPDCPDCACVQDGQCLCSPSKPSAEPIEQATHSCGLDVVSRCVACAKPSAPVEIDERPEGCCCPPKGYNGLWAAGPCPVHQGLRKLEQARTALERKPS
ncbi:TPA: hypothetical protein QEM72_004557 [Pseudomonas putida]|uniref:hypothetical protein n=1 Tax=Pseudomonas putida TaxID=303 RepID=UPI002363DCED|nr:hypothetical protein [Pseudomonas putida]MDD2077147.1 hypothetical protein [Pseudomonas putida]HDS1693970.1 hypothetical protein [Pseudomonas putida]